MKSIEELRRELNMSLKEFSEYYEIPYNTVRQWENKERTPPKYVIKLLNEVIDLKAKGVQINIDDIKKKKNIAPSTKINNSMSKKEIIDPKESKQKNNKVDIEKMIKRMKEILEY